MIKLKDYYLLTALLLISFFSVYFMPAMLNRLVFLIILYAAYKTRLDYVYLVWFFIINDAPGRLFSAGEFAVEARIPLYPVVAGISISFQELFLILYILKWLGMNQPLSFIFKKEFTWFFLFGLLTVAYSIPLGMSFDNMIRTFRMLLPWSLIFIVPAYIDNRQTLIRASILLFPIVFLALGAQILSYITNNYLDHYLRGAESRFIGMEEGGVSRSYSAVYITLFAIIQGLYFFFNRKIAINQNLLTLVIFLGVFSIFLTATRGWIIAMAVLLFGVLVLFGFSRGLKRWFRLTISATLAFFVIANFMPSITLQMQGAYQRLTTMEEFAAGDVTAGGTLQRIDVRAPRVMSKFWESPFIGWGFSDDFYGYSDQHVGHHNILLNIGIIGFVLLNGLFVSLCIKTWTLARKKQVRQSEGNAPLIYVLGLFFVLVIHSTSTQFWGYPLGLSKTLFFGFFFAAVNAVAQHYRHTIGFS